MTDINNDLVPEIRDCTEAERKKALHVICVGTDHPKALRDLVADVHKRAPGNGITDYKCSICGKFEYGYYLKNHGEICRKCNAVRAGKSEPSDTDRLNWLDQVNTNMNKQYGTKYGWRYDCNHVRASILSEYHMPPLSIREAIDQAMIRQRNSDTEESGAG